MFICKPKQPRISADFQKGKAESIPAGETTLTHVNNDKICCNLVNYKGSEV